MTLQSNKIPDLPCPATVLSMMMRTIALAAVLFLVLTGCKDTRPGSRKTISPAIEHTHSQDMAPHPYYYGLIEEYRTTLAGDPRNLAALIGLGHAYSDSGAWREAIVQYDLALKIDPRNADVLTDLGIAYRNMGMIDQALEQYRRALEYEPGHLNARYNLGMVYGFDLGNYTLAIHIWEEVLRLAPNHPNAVQMRTNIRGFQQMVKKGHP